MKPEKLFVKICAGQLKNVSFKEFVQLLKQFGFVLDRVSGSHHIFRHQSSKAMLNLQKVGGEAKPYQIRQFLKLVEEHHLDMAQ